MKKFVAAFLLLSTLSIILLTNNTAKALGETRLQCYWSEYYQDCVVFSSNTACAGCYGLPAEIHCHY